jgi:hypothetical protein
MTHLPIVFPGKDKLYLYKIRDFLQPAGAIYLTNYATISGSPLPAGGVDSQPGANKAPPADSFDLHRTACATSSS